MSTNIIIAVTCIVILFVVGAVLPFVQQDLEGESTTYVTDKFTGDIIENTPSITGLDIAISIVGMLTWNFSLNIWINLFFWIIKIILALALADMAWLG